MEQRVFHFNEPSFDVQLYAEQDVNLYLNQVADHLMCVLSSLGDAPLIRFFDPKDTGTTLSAHLAERLATRIQEYRSIDPNYPHKNPFGTKQNTRLILLDRDYDRISPFLHSLGYQAILNDFFHVEGSKITYHQGDTLTTAKLDEKDETWVCLLNLL
jgi:hypothetical protein